MSQYLIGAIEDTPNIDVRTETEVVGGGGESHLQELVLRAKATGLGDEAVAQVVGELQHEGSATVADRI